MRRILSVPTRVYTGISDLHQQCCFISLPVSFLVLSFLHYARSESGEKEGIMKKLRNETTLSRNDTIRLTDGVYTIMRLPYSEVNGAPVE